MNNTIKIFSVLVLLFAGTTVWLAWERYIPYVSPENTCFTRNGIAVGTEKDCESASVRTLQERAIALGERAQTPWTKAKLYRKIVNQCQQVCNEDKKCSFYNFLTFGNEFSDYSTFQIAGACIIFE